ncbi:NAD-glutamate dehydrogenase domain-containing protein [Rhodococcus sp. NPDC057529]|uniref:NAD-glutamate dehydrogenase domain-containing protein n=1 Tax=Rhodococcus sp. NPDC057529 TaxID=3346158 RepID=UPI00367280A2
MFYHAETQAVSDAVPEGFDVDPDYSARNVDWGILRGLAKGDLELSVRPGATADDAVRMVLYTGDGGVSLSRVLQILRGMDVEVVDERTTALVREDGLRCLVYDFGLHVSGAPRDGLTALFGEEDFRTRFLDTFRAAWTSRADSDRFNALVVHAGLDWRQATALRAYGKYLKQARFPYSPERIASVLVDNPRTTRALVSLFEARFDPALRTTDPSPGIDDAVDAVVVRMNHVVSMDADRILRAYLTLIRATQRTNYYIAKSPSSAGPCLSLKLHARDIDELPLPRPEIETFVYSPTVEGVHLRFGSVARGGLRWSSRSEDYRTEVLGLVKAQAVKNAVIVPVGAKGGFVVKQPFATNDDRVGTNEITREEGISGYRTFISGLLDITDNLSHDLGTVHHPDNVVCHDDSDTYLVVAADKGTASFSDIANEVAAQYGFWLGDAFASGGSVGYDHKAMGITARGAWESVRQHFGELDLDPDCDEFTVVGIGDMSGDVFGNGMLLSDRIRLVAAFDHRHIFIDPDPDPSISFAERKRMFSLTQSSWQDYDASLISEGGGVWDRTRKSIPLSPQARQALGIDSEHTRMSPPELIQAILCAPVDLLWNGGIGTYVKASDEDTLAVGDKTNDSLRVDGRALRCRVVVEGGNLGLTARGRIEYAKSGGRINTDAIDNSAGVSCSDHEVNLKILLSSLRGDQQLVGTRRAEFLESMSADVARLVLSENASHNAVLSESRAHASDRAQTDGRLISHLQATRGLDVELEALPNHREIATRVAQGNGLTSPELGTLLAHVKLAIKDDVLSSEVPDLDIFRDTLTGYFPHQVTESFPDAVNDHPLRREIIATQTVNRMVDTGGITFAFRLGEETGASSVDVVRAHVAATTIFGMDKLWERIRQSDIPKPLGSALALEARRLLDRAARWLLTNRPQPLDITAAIDHFLLPVAQLSPKISDRLRRGEAEFVKSNVNRWVEQGTPEDLAVEISELLYRYCLLDIVDVASAAGSYLDDAADLYFALSDRLEIDRTLAAVSSLPRDDRWNALARMALRDDLYRSLKMLTRDVLGSTSPDWSPEERVEAWEQSNGTQVGRGRRTLAAIFADGELSVTRLSVAALQIRNMITTEIQLPVFARSGSAAL